MYNLYSQFLEYNVSIGVFKRKIKKILMNEFQLDPYDLSLYTIIEELICNLFIWKVSISSSRLYMRQIR